MKNGAIVFRNIDHKSVTFDCKIALSDETITKSKDESVWFAYFKEQKTNYTQFVDTDFPSISIANMQDIENEFFQLLNSKESVTVNYGANLEMSSSVLNKYCYSLLEKDILRRNNFNISGITSSWCYFGQKHSLFQWHIEDSGLFYYFNCRFICC